MIVYNSLDEAFSKFKFFSFLAFFSPVELKTKKNNQIHESMENFDDLNRF